MSTVASFVGSYNEGSGSSQNAPFLPNTSGALGMQEISGILKQIYDNQKLAVLYYKNNPAWAIGGTLWMSRAPTAWTGRRCSTSLRTMSSRPTRACVRSTSRP